ncbi:MAG: cyclic nucleotide-binding domain-containing protein, partial [Burkholderiaceae bacterium]
GLPVALMFHPLNYVLAFMSCLFKFDLISALYARMSTQIFRTSINVPATAVVSGLFPQSYRAMIRPFLRGTVVRIGLFLGSTLILLSDKVFHPRYLSLVALPFVITWLTMPFWLKRRYADILTDLVSGDMGDIKSMESADIKQLFRDPSMRRKLRDDFSRSSPADALWFGRLLKTVNDEELDRLIVQKIDAADTDTRVQLMELMTSDDPLAISVLARMALEDVPRQQAAAIGTLARIAPSRLPEGADFSPLIEAPSMEVRAYALAAMLPTDPPRYGAMVRDWIGDPNDSVRMAGVIAAGVSGSQEFVASLTTLLANDVDSGTRAAVLNALNNISPPQINELVQGELVHPSADVRLAAVSAYQVTDKTALQTLIPLLGDTSAAINHQVRMQIVDAPFHDGKQLIRALGTPRRKVREEIFKILDVLDIKDLDVVRFVRGQAEGAYKYLIEAQAVKKLHSCPQRDLLETHLRQQGQVQIENMIRVLATQDTSGKMRIVSRGLLSTNARQHANSLEALGDLLDNAVARFIVPLIDASPTDQKLAAARKFFKLKPFSASNAALIEHLLEHRHWVTRALALEAASGCGVTGISQERLETAQADPESGFIQSAARRLMQVEKISPNNQEERMQANSQETPAQSGSIAISEKILLLNRIDIFAGLSVVELSAIATACEEVDFPPGARVISQNDAGDTLYLIISGKVAVMKTREDGVEMELDQMTSGDYFGEMALFEDSKRSAGIVTLEDTRLLFLHKQEFNDMVREYPQIALAICNALSGRIRRLHQRMEALGSATE